MFHFSLFLYIIFYSVSASASNSIEDLPLLVQDLIFNSSAPPPTPKWTVYSDAIPPSLSASLESLSAFSQTSKYFYRYSNLVYKQLVQQELSDPIHQSRNVSIIASDADYRRVYRCLVGNGAPISVNNIWQQYPTIRPIRTGYGGYAIRAIFDFALSSKHMEHLPVVSNHYLKAMETEVHHQTFRMKETKEVETKLNARYPNAFVGFGGKKFVIFAIVDRLFRVLRDKVMDLGQKNSLKRYDILQVVGIYNNNNNNNQTTNTVASSYKRKEYFYSMKTLNLLLNYLDTNYDAALDAFLLNKIVLSPIQAVLFEDSTNPSTSEFLEYVVYDGVALTSTGTESPNQHFAYLHSFQKSTIPDLDIPSRLELSVEVKCRGTNCWVALRKKRLIETDAGEYATVKGDPATTVNIRWKGVMSEEDVERRMKNLLIKVKSGDIGDFGRLIINNAWAEVEDQESGKRRWVRVGNVSSCTE